MRSSVSMQKDRAGGRPTARRPARCIRLHRRYQRRGRCSTPVARVHSRSGLVLQSIPPLRLEAPMAHRPAATDPGRRGPRVEREGRRPPRRGVDGDGVARRSTRPTRSTRDTQRPGARRGRQAALRAARRGARAAQPPQPDGRRRRAVVRLRALCAHDERDAGACSTRRATRWCWPSTTTTSRPRCAITEQLISHGVDAFVFVGLHHDPALFALLESYGRPYVLTWGVDPMRRHPSIGFDNRAATLRDDPAPDRARPPPLRPAERATDGNDRALERGAGDARRAGRRPASRSTSAARSTGRSTSRGRDRR